MSRLKHHTPKYEDAVGAFGLPYHMEMIGDNERVNACKKAIGNIIMPQTIFCELGCGTGVFSIHAAQLCEKVYAVEKDANILKIAIKNAKAAGVESKIEFIHSDAMTVKLPEKCDVIFCEMMSIWLINEPQVPVINRARKKLLKENGKIIPQRIINLAEIANVDYQFGAIEIKASLPQFSGIRPPRIMTESRVINIIDFSGDVSMNIEENKKMRPLVSGVANCIRLSSIVEFADEINFFSTDTLMPTTIVPLNEELAVKAEEEVIFSCQYTHRSNLDDSIFNIKPNKNEKIN